MIISNYQESYPYQEKSVMGEGRARIKALAIFKYLNLGENKTGERSRQTRGGKCLAT